jgi:hypothetical protein
MIVGKRPRSQHGPASKFRGVSFPSLARPAGARWPRAGNYRHLKVGRHEFFVKAIGPGGTGLAAATRSFNIA